MSNDGLFKIFNVNNGQMIAEKCYKNSLVDFRIDATKLCVREVVGGRHDTQSYTYTLYDLERGRG